eukprot:6372829-Amphidinium_carterae.1
MTKSESNSLSNERELIATKAIQYLETEDLTQFIPNPKVSKNTSQKWYRVTQSTEKRAILFFSGSFGLRRGWGRSSYTFQFHWQRKLIPVAFPALVAVRAMVCTRRKICQGTTPPPSLDVVLQD